MWLPLSVKIGIPAVMFWDMSPRTFTLYYETWEKADKQRRKSELMRADYEAWLAGAYVTKAVASVLSSKGNAKYPTKPYGIDDDEDTQAAAVDEDTAAGIAARRFEQYIKVLNAKFEKIDDTEKK